MSARPPAPSPYECSAARPFYTAITLLAIAAVSAACSNGPTAQSHAAASASGIFTFARPNADCLRNPHPPDPKTPHCLDKKYTVMLRAYVLPNGSAEKVEIKKSSGNARLDEAARTAAMKWRFEPARMGSKPVPAWVVIPFTWSLKS
ncbi:MAG: energy transducer TonB [Azoarcus sp.]|nr:energy transducer TonB [Azoarcus sp.]